MTHPRSLLASAVLLSMLTIGLPARAATVGVIDFPEGCAIALRGAIQPDDVTRFERATIERPECLGIALDGQFGQDQAALRIGAIIRRRGMLTTVPAGAACAGPCFYVFCAGTIRIVDPKGKLGVRMPTFARSEPIVREIRGLIQKHGVAAAEPVISSAERIAFQVAATLGQYLIAMGVSPAVLAVTAETSESTTRWLSPEQMTELKLIVAPK